MTAGEALSRGPEGLAILAEIFELAPAFIAVLRGPEHVFELANPACYQLIGQREIIGRPLRDALPELLEQGYTGLMDGVFRTGTPFVGKGRPVRLARTPGRPPEERYVDFVIQPVTDADGTRSGVFIHGVDVTDQMLARAEVERSRSEAEEARQRAEEANMVKSQFLATMSHELRTPLNAQIGYAQLLEMGLGGPLTDEQQRYVSRMTQSSAHLLSLINDVLDFSKIEAGALSAQREDLSTGPLVQEALDLVRPQADARGIGLCDERPSPEGVPFVGDDQRVRQILLNLLSNAVKFTDRGGRITVTCGTVTSVPPSVQVYGAGPWAFVAVADTGIGVAPHQRVHLFDPFHQVDGTHTRQQGGTGLGLAISRRLARLMGGDLTAESEPGAGSMFTLWLPAIDHPDDGVRVAMPAARETATERVARARYPTVGMDAPGLDAVGELLRGMLDEILAAYAERLRVDPEAPRARRMRRPELEDHALTLLSDLAQSLLIISEGGSKASELLRDGSAIQRTIAEQHGVRRHAQGWTEHAVRRDHEILREEIERAVRTRIRSDADRGSGPGVEEAVAMLAQLVTRAEEVSVASWRRAAGGGMVSR